ncbi:MAG TPA: Uma2 family endonuclease, partial [Saprospiraceae bacterium]|nr:Uma2 family endonuclease [Saprospiraceae bacterium]
MTALLSRRKEITLEDLALHYGPVELQRPLSKEEFTALAERYPDLSMERESSGTVTVMSPVKKGSGNREFKLGGLFYVWFAQTNLGEFFSPSTGFDLPSGATKSPDIAWVSPERLAANPGGEEDFVKIVPDFVAEVRSSTDRLKKLQTKMTDTWMANGVRLAWLIDPYEEKVYIYRPGAAPEIVEGFAGKKLPGEDVLPGFELPLE